MNETLAILEKVHAFYSTSFTQLIQYTTALLALVGILVPSYLAFQQNRQAKRETAALSSEIETQISLARTALKDEIKADLAESEKKLSELVASTKQDLEKQFKKMSSVLSARTFHLQANSLLQGGNFARAAYDSCEAGIAYSETGEDGNLIRVISIAAEALEQLKSDAFESHAEYALEKKIKSFMAAIEKINKTGRFSDDMRKLNRLMEAAKKEPLTVSA